MFCSNCGSKTAENSKFCSSCGTAKAQAVTPNNVSNYEPGVATSKSAKNRQIIIACCVLAAAVLIGSILLLRSPADSVIETSNPAIEVVPATPAPSPVEATPIPTLTPAPAPQIIPQQIAIGDLIAFGNYDWRVLEVRGNQAFVVSEYTLLNRMYHHSVDPVTWVTSDIHRYLNDDFFYEFSPQDRARIATTTVINDDNQWWGTPGGSSTKDRIFLLSIEEVVRFFGDSGQLANRPVEVWGIWDEYSEARIARNLQGSTTWWWLRSPGYYPDFAAFVDSGGGLDLTGIPVFWEGDGIGIRPALWLYIE